jgi:hypothetical protein
MLLQLMFEFVKTNLRPRIRAYRMKLDEWKLWKNNSKTERRRAKTTIRHQSRNIEVSRPKANALTSTVTAIQSPVVVAVTPVDCLEIYGVLVPMGPLDISELLPLLSSLNDSPEMGLEIMLTKWNSNGSYLKAALKYLWYQRSSFHIYFRTRQKKTLFHLMETNLPFHEGLCLARKCLEIDFKRAQRSPEEIHWAPGSFLYPTWMNDWREACASQSWGHINEWLNLTNSKLDSGNHLFTSAASLVLGEKLIQRNLEMLDNWRAQGDLAGGIETDFAKICLDESMDILTSYNDHVLLAVDISLYKRILQLSKVFHAQDHIDQRRQLIRLVQYRKAFLELKSLHASFDGANGMVQNLLDTANRGLRHTSIF